MYLRVMKYQGLKKSPVGEGERNSRVISWSLICLCLMFEWVKKNQRKQTWNLSQHVKFSSLVIFHPFKVDIKAKLQDTIVHSEQWEQGEAVKNT